MPTPVPMYKETYTAREELDTAYAAFSDGGTEQQHEQQQQQEMEEGKLGWGH